MDQFKIFQDELEKIFPGLIVFSDLNWDEITREYIASHDQRPDNLEDFIFNFPQFLQDKATVGDCPVYLFEIAYFELLQNQTLNSDEKIPTTAGLHLNPSLSFLNLEFDINLMMDEATKGNVQVIQRPHILCIYRHPELGLHHIEITTPVLEVLQTIEKGEIPIQVNILSELIKLGVIIKVGP